ELEEFLEREYPGIDLDGAAREHEGTIDPYPIYRMLLLPLDSAKQSRKWHPEGDVLYHTLQVFELARQHRPYDEEFLLAALLHDVGKGIDPFDHVEAGLQALEGVITERTRFFIEHHMQAHDYRTGALSSKQKRRLEASPDFDDLMLLRDLDDAGRVPGAVVGTVDEALDYLKELARENG
ncbi:MAG: HD domain-containing protein, partial [Planctomycetia bacterium]|nr:HD domain-containing protein [Planctomycetia bacterium]